MTDRTLQSEARRLEVVTLIALVLLAILLVLRSVLIPIVAGMADNHPNSEAFWGEVGPILIDALPAFALLGALDATHKLLKRLARGETFSDSVGKGVRGIGMALIWAAIAAAVVVPWLHAWVDGRYGFGGVNLEPASVVMAVVGAAMLLVGRLIARAADLKSELESFV